MQTNDLDPLQPLTDALADSCLKLSDGRDNRKVQALAEGKFEVLGARVAQINRMRRQLKRLIDACAKNPVLEVRPFISSFRTAAAL